MSDDRLLCLNYYKYIRKTRNISPKNRVVYLLYFTVFNKNPIIILVLRLVSGLAPVIKVSIVLSARISSGEEKDILKRSRSWKLDPLFHTFLP